MPIQYSMICFVRLKMPMTLSPQVACIFATNFIYSIQNKENRVTPFSIKYHFTWNDWPPETNDWVAKQWQNNGKHILSVKNGVIRDTNYETMPWSLLWASIPFEGETPFRMAELIFRFIALLLRIVFAFRSLFVTISRLASFVVSLFYCFRLQLSCQFQWRFHFCLHNCKSVFLLNGKTDFPEKIAHTF